MDVKQMNKGDNKAVDFFHNRCPRTIVARPYQY